MESCGSWFEELLGPAPSTGDNAVEGSPVKKSPVARLSLEVFSRGLSPLFDMWPKYDVNVSLKESIFNDLIDECRHNYPGARLSSQLRSKLERLSVDSRKELVSRVRDGCAPLFIACMRGHAEMVDYLIRFVGADVEQRGLYEVAADRSVHFATPLWCAAVSGRLNVIKVLVENGANVNAASDSGSTPVRSACFMTHMDIVKYLVENGADILKPNHNGGTCLINSVQSAPLCQYLLQHGAAVNVRDIQNKTALHYAIQEHRCETTALLLDHGADPHACSRLNDDALRTACIKGAQVIFDLLRERVHYEPERLADAYELLGSTLLDEHNDTQTALQHWRTALQIRLENGKDGMPIPKRPSMPPKETFNYAKEFETLEDLNSLDVDAMRMQSLLICERVLGEQHKDTLFRLMYRGAAYADALRYQRCIDLWRRALEVRIMKDSILIGDTCFTAQALVRLFVDLNEKLLLIHDGEREGKLPQFEDVASVFLMLAHPLIECRPLLEIHPINKRQQESYDRILRCITHLVYLLVKTAKSEQDQHRVCSLVTDLIRYNPCSATTGDSLLHLCVSKLNTIKSSYFAEDNQVTLVVFPDFEVTKVLLQCGAPVRATNKSRSTPLHVASNPYNFDNKLVKLLLDHGAHLDQSNKSGERPSVTIPNNKNNTINLVNYTTLRCLAAVVVCRYRIPYHGQVPSTLENFMKLHDYY
ncbi:Protein fem-1-like protein C [Frankliniella fusca]|uniref:Protein fem-1-like protein C n=1 Tax=Frankliniella fusca TaxID=407009 RepID=A0AAE1HL66_9NEOP|nr:Protein fem-1-like protein C [Frankliniella fusca]